MAQSKYFPDLENGKSIADVEQIETAFSLVEQDIKNAGKKADQVFSPTSTNAQSGVAIVGELEKYQTKINFDDTPTPGSNNPVTSDGVFNTLVNLENIMTSKTQSMVDKKVDKETGKGLSSNDYTDAEKQKNADNAESVSKIKENYYTDLIQLATVINGKYIDGSHKWVDVSTFTSYIWKVEDIISFDKIKVWSNQLSYAIGFYSSEEPSDSTYISGKMFSSTSEASIYENVKIPSNAVIAVICNRNATSEDIEISGFPHLDQATAKLDIKALKNAVDIMDDKTQSDLLQACKYENAYINAQGGINDSASWQDYLLYDLYDQITFKAYTNDINLHAVGFYSSNIPSQDTFISGIKFKAFGLSETVVNRSDIPVGTKSILLCSRTATGIETALTGIRNITSDIANLKNIVSDLERVNCGVGNIKAIYKNIPNANDFTIIKDEIWFAENIYENGVSTEKTKLHRYKIVNNALFFIDTIMSDFGHWNVVDYNEYNDCLVFGNAANSTTTEGNFFSVVKNPLALSGNVTLSTCGIKYPVDIGYKVQAVWGDNNFGKNNIVYLMSNNASKITKVMLKRDSDGNFAVNKTTGYGEFIVLESKELSGVDYGVGGADFWGDTLYIGIGVNYRLAKMSMTDYSVEEIEKKYYYDDGTAYSGSTQGIHVDNNYLWWFVNVAGQTENYLIQYYV